ncbi:MAG TPA: hypothetical protein VFY48_01560 [Solirubrobacterales bacterium]|nr:hypothetical protein [Solirubrobacterales bacterium]
MGRSSAIRVLAVGTLSTRVAYGIALLVVPARVAGNRWLGPGARAPAAQVALRGLGAREAGLHGLALAAYLSGRDARPLLAASIAGDLVDIASTTAARGGLPDGSAPATAAVAGGSALLTAAVAAGLSR